MKRIARVSITAVAVGAMIVAATPSLAWAQSRPAAGAAAAPTTQSQQPTPDRDFRPFRGPGDRRFEGRSGDGMRPPPRMEWRRGDARPENFSEPSSDEWKEIEAFMKSHSPERWQRLEDIGDERQQGIRKMFADRYRTLQELKELDPELYQIRIARMPIEDKVFDLGWRLSHRQSDKPDDTKAQLRAQLRLLVKSRLEERAVHVRRMEKRLKADEQRIEELVDANLRDIAEDSLPRDLRPPQFIPRRERRPDGESANDATATPTGDQ